MKTFIEHLTEEADPKVMMKLLNEANDITEDQEKLIDEAVERLVKEHENGNDIESDGAGLLLSYYKKCGSSNILMLLLLLLLLAPTMTKSIEPEL